MFALALGEPEGDSSAAVYTFIALESISAPSAPDLVLPTSSEASFASSTVVLSSVGGTTVVRPARWNKHDRFDRLGSRGSFDRRTCYR